MQNSGNFEQFYTQFVDEIYYFVLRLVKNEADAEEITSEVFYRAYQRFSSLTQPHKIGVWLRKVAYNLCMDEFRARAKATFVSLNDTAEDTNAFINSIPSDAPLPSQIIEEQELAGYLRSALLQLPQDYRTVLTLGELEGYSDRQISEIMGRSKVAIKSLRQRAKRALKRQILRGLRNSGGNKVKRCGRK